MATIQDLGKVAYLNKGAYNSETTYEINDVVSFNGSSYVSKTNENRGNLPTNTIYWSIVASKGDKGETGKPFVIEKTYMTIEAMVADYDNMNINDYVMISGNIEEEQNATLWTKTANEVSPYKWVYLADFSGASGITGATPNIIIGNVTEGNQPAVTRRAGSSNENPILDFILKTGPKGDIGDTGNGISSIEKTGTSGLVDTYTITYTDGTTSTFQVTNGEDADITPEEFEELQNEVNELKDENQRLKATLPTTTGTGENITLEKTAEMEFVVPPLPRGNTYQETTTGKNLYNKNTASVDGANSQNIANITTLDTNTDYTFYANEQTWVTAKLYDSNNQLTRTIGATNTTKIINFTTANDEVKANLIFYSGNNTVIANYNFNNVMLVKGTYTSSTILPYESYSGGYASPSPSYPQEVQVVKGSNVISISNKNLLDTQDVAVINGYIVSNLDIIGDNGPSNKILYITIQPNTTYTVSKNNFSLDAFGIASTVNIPAKDVPITQKAVNKSANSLTITTGANDNYLAVYCKGQNKIFPELFNYIELQIEKGSTATTYEAHQGQELQLDLPTGMELCKIGDYQDYFWKDETTNKWYLHKEIKKHTVDGSEVTEIAGNSFNEMYTNGNIARAFTINDMRIASSRADTMSNTFNVVNETALWNGVVVGIQCYLNANKIAISAPISNIESFLGEALTVNNYTNAYIQYLASIGTYFYYISPIDIEITDTTLINQLEAIYNAISYEGQTNISGTSGGTNPLFDVEAYQNTKLILENLDNRLSLIEG